MDAVDSRVKEPDLHFVYYQEHMTKAMKELTRKAQDMVRNIGWIIPEKLISIFTPLVPFSYSEVVTNIPYY